MSQSLFGPKLDLSLLSVASDGVWLFGSCSLYFEGFDVSSSPSSGNSDWDSVFCCLSVSFDSNLEEHLWGMASGCCTTPSLIFSGGGGGGNDSGQTSSLSGEGGRGWGTGRGGGYGQTSSLGGEGGRGWRTGGGGGGGKDTGQTCSLGGEGGRGLRTGGEGGGGGAGSLLVEILEVLNGCDKGREEGREGLVGGADGVKVDEILEHFLLSPGWDGGGRADSVGGAGGLHELVEEVVLG